MADPPAENKENDEKTDLRDLAKTDNPSLKVSRDSRPQSVARAIGHVIRESPKGNPPVLLATGPHAINQAVKAIAIARRHLLDDSAADDFAVVPRFEKGLRDGSNVSLVLSKCGRVEATPESDQSELSAKQGTDVFKLAGAIAGRVREGAKQIDLYVKGPVPVLIAVKAIGAAQEYVSDAGTSLKFTAALVDRENPALRGEVKSTFTLLTVMATS